MHDTEVLVIGGGLSGLSVAWWLARAGICVEVWEQRARPGGLLATRQKDGYTLEQAASIMLNFRPEVTELLGQSGLASKKLVPAPGTGSARYLVHQGSLVAVPMRLGAFLSAPLWSTRGKLRLLVEPWIPRGGSENETVTEFITRRLGREALEKAFEPYLAGTLASDPDRANARAALPRLTHLEQRYGSIALGVCARKLRRHSGPAIETFSFEGGMATLINALVAAPGIRLHTRRTVTQVEHDGNSWRVVSHSQQGERAVRARHLVLAVPAPAAADLLAPRDAVLGELVRGIECASLVVVHFGFDRQCVAHPLNGMGFLVPRREGLPLTGCQWMSSLFAERAPPGKVLASVYLGGSRIREALEWDDARIIETAYGALKPLVGLRAAPDMTHIDRHARALPLYYGAYPERVRAIHRQLQHWPGLHLVANYLGGVSTRDRIVSAYATARRIQALTTPGCRGGTPVRRLLAAPEAFCG